jgi:protocatechuate 3,4-dioxygenase beta subunit
MHRSDMRRASRRQLLQFGAALALPVAALAASGLGLDHWRGLLASAARAQELPPTPPCGGDEPTPPQTEGPYFKPASPERASLLEPDLPGTRLLVTGTVLTRSCQPVAGALLDFWQADAAGRYDLQGYRLRGHQYADAAGRYTLETIVPGLYTGRTRHIHVRVQAPGGPALTTQLYFPDEPRNRTDPLFRPALLLALEPSDGEPLRARFDFVLAA